MVRGYSQDQINRKGCSSQMMEKWVCKRDVKHPLFFLKL
ncbi:MAG: hypothetical protein TIS_02927 [Tissierella sp.]